MKIAFFGTPDIARIVLDELKQSGITLSLIISNPDALVGRKQILTPPPAALWAKENNVELFQPASLKDKEALSLLTSTDWDLFIVAAYGKILPKWLLDIPKYQTINVHPSLLPKLRGASPLRSAILTDQRETGVSIMLLDEEMDHGPLLGQLPADISLASWPVDGTKLDTTLAHQGGAFLASLLPKWLAGEIIPVAQNHAEATFCTKITKDMAELELDPLALPSGQEAYQTLLKIRAFSGWPETYFMYEGKRIKIKAAELDKSGQLQLKRIIPEGKKEMDFDVYFK
jgi:methionyl-tRNA formyltransferase